MLDTYKVVWDNSGHMNPHNRIALTHRLRETGVLVGKIFPLGRQFVRKEGPGLVRMARAFFMCNDMTLAALERVLRICP